MKHYRDNEGDKYLFIAYHPEHPVVVLETVENELITTSISDFLDMEVIKVE